jgi:hypothetical protein
MSLVRAGAVLSTVAASALILSAAPAQAAAAPVIDDTLATSFALGVSRSTSFTLAARVTGASSVTVANASTRADACDTWSETLTKVDARTFGDDFEAPADMFADHGGNGCAGTWRATFTAKGTGGQDTATATYSVRRQARIVRLNASPEPVRKGAKVTVTAKLERASWDDGRYHGYARRTAELQFKTVDGSYRTVKEVVGSSTGTYRTTATQKVKGCWRLVFRGSGTTTPAKVAGDCVAVR